MPPSLTTSITSSIISLIFIIILGAIYNELALKMTEYELPKTEAKFAQYYAVKATVAREKNRIIMTPFFGSFVHNLAPKLFISNDELDIILNLRNLEIREHSIFFQ